MARYFVFWVRGNPDKIEEFVKNTEHEEYSDERAALNRYNHLDRYHRLQQLSHLQLLIGYPAIMDDFIDAAPNEINLKTLREKRYK